MTANRLYPWHEPPRPPLGPRIKPVPIDSSEAAKFYSGHPELVTALATPQLLQTLSLMFHRSFMSLGAYCDSDIQGVAQWPIDWKGPVGIAQRLPVRYTGLVTEPENIPASIHALQKALAKRRIGRAYYSFAPHYRLNIEELQHQLSRVGLPATIKDDFEPLRGRPITGRESPVVLVSNVTCILPIEGASEEEIMAAVPQARARTSLRQTLRRIRARDATLEDMAVHLPRLLTGTYGRTGNAVPYPPRAFDIFWQRHHTDPNVLMRTMALDASDQPVGMAIGITHHGTVYSFLLMRDYTLAKSLNVTARLITDMAAEARAKGCNSFDLGGGTAGIIESKMRLGSQRHSYVDMQVTHPCYRPLFELWEYRKNRGRSSPAAPRPPE
jgi:hypothetical protein